ncbi:hypothetical protein TM239_01290 [Bradyrhizobium sp. TM239]|nr:hypothetical protein TM239_01290 [Bradyrhizobium sp. TM239]
MVVRSTSPPRKGWAPRSQFDCPERKRRAGATNALDKQALDVCLTRCLELKKQFLARSTAELIPDLEDEMRDQRRAYKLAKTAS